MKGYTITCQNVNPPFIHNMPVLTPIDISKIDAFIWSPLVDECVGISMLQDTNRFPYPIDSEESHKIFPPGPLYHEETLKLFWKELDYVTKNIPKRFVVTYPPTHLEHNLFKPRVEKLNKIASELLISLGWKHYEFDAELDETNYWCHFSLNSKQSVYKKIENDLK
jgi:hypothetical protein